MESASLGDLLGIVISAVSLVVTAVLLIFGLKIGSEFREAITRISKIEDVKKSQSQEFDAIYTLIEILRLQSDVSFRTILTLSAHLEKMSIPTEKISDVQSTKILKNQIEEYKTKSHRTLLYLLLLKENRGKNFLLRLSNIVSSFPDELTIQFLTVFATLVPPDEGVLLDRAVRALKLKIRKIDSFGWTGRR